MIVSPWEGYSGAVSLTFDDGTRDQLENAVPALERFGLRATFYLLPQGEHWRERLEPWQPAVARGHEVGNHSLSHICSNTLAGRRGGLEDRTVTEIAEDVFEAQRRLTTVFPDRENWTFAYPCYCTFVGRGRNRQSYVPLIAEHFLAGRGGGEKGFGNRPELVDLACVWAQPAEGMSGFEMIGLVEAVAAQGQWLVLVFHKIDGDRLSVASTDLHLLFQHLQRRQQEIWTAPLVDVAHQVSRWQNQQWG